MTIFKNSPSLLIKFVISISLILGVTLTLLAINVHRDEDKLLSESLDNRVRTMGTFVSLISPEAILAFDITTLDHFIEEIIVDPDIFFAMIVTPKGIPLTTVPSEDASHAHIMQYIQGSTPLPENHELRRHDIVFDGELLGELIIGVDRQRLANLTDHNLLMQLLVSFLIIVFLASLIISIFHVNVLRPVKHLITGATKVSQGEYTARVPVLSADELGRLSLCFNHMAAKIDSEQTELQQLNAELTREVEVRRKIEKELHTAKEEAETANRAKSQFLANMSHELRTPLNSIIGFSEMMGYEIKGPLSDDYKEYALLITNSGRILLETVNSILDLSKIEAGKLDLDTSPTQIKGVVDDVLALLNIQAMEKGIELKNETNELHELDVDPLRIRQVLTNVIGNAIKFTHKGGVSITSRCDDKGHRLVITDTGIGMSPKSIETALEPFGQVHANTLTRRYGGTGLGLSISKRIMELHGGTLTIRSTKDHGTEVTLYFPAELASESVA